MSGNKPRRLADAQEQHAAGHRVERSPMADGHAARKALHPVAERRRARTWRLECVEKPERRGQPRARSAAISARTASSIRSRASGEGTGERRACGAEVTTAAKRPRCFHDVDAASRAQAQAGSVPSGDSLSNAATSQ